MIFNHHKRGTSAIEYVVMIIIIIGAMLLIQKYLLRGIAGKWRDVGDTWGYGRQFDPKKTTECLYDMTVNKWILYGCFEACISACDSKYGIDANLVCEANCPKDPTCACPP